MKPKLTKIDLTDPQDRIKGSSTWRQRTSPYAVYFVYAPQGNYMITGYDKKVEPYVDKHFPKCIYRYTFWKKGSSRGSWVFNGVKCYIDTPDKKNNKYVFYSCGVNGKIEHLKLRRIPNKWIPEYDEIVKLINKLNSHS